MWRRVRVLLFAALAISFGFRLLRTTVNPAWDGWPAVRYGVGIAFVVALFVYGVAVWMQRR